MRSIVLALALVAPPAAAQTLSGAEAERLLFPARGIAVAISSAVGEAERRVLEVMPAEAQKAGQGFRYYGSIAFSPSDGLQSDSIRGAFNFHDIATADAAALAACESAKSNGAEDCIVGARILPTGWERRPLQLSQEATDALRRVYLRARGPKAFAVSRSNGAWALARGDEAASDAMAACNENAAASGRAQDCSLAVVD